MTITVHCVNERCGKLLQVPDQATEKVRCPRCGQVQPAAGPDLLLPGEEAMPAESGAGAIVSASDLIPVPARAQPESEVPPPLPRRSRVPIVLVCPVCEADVGSKDESCPHCKQHLDEAALYDEAERLKRRRSLLQGFSFAASVIGLFVVGAGTEGADDVQLAFSLGAGFLLSCLGLALMVIAKRYSAVWMLLSPLWVGGVILLACLPDEIGQRLRRIKEHLGEARKRRRRRSKKRAPGDTLRLVAIAFTIVSLNAVVLVGMYIYFCSLIYDLFHLDSGLAPPAKPAPPAQVQQLPPR